MDNKLLIGFGGFLAVFLVFPFVAQYLREGNVGSTETTVQTTSPADKAKPVSSNIPAAPPLLNSQNLVGTEWQFLWESYKIKITIAPNGVCYATHPLMRSVTGMDYYEGRWSMMGSDRVVVEARFAEQHLREELIISGYDLYTTKGEKIQRY